MEKLINLINIIHMTIAVVLFYFGDIITTFLILNNGGHELNRYLAVIGFNGFVLLKTAFLIFFFVLVYYLDKLKFYKESGMITGMVLMAGLLATLYNLGFYRLVK